MANVLKMIKTSKELLNILNPVDKEHMKYISKVLFAIFKSIYGPSFSRKDITEFANSCLPNVLPEILNQDTLLIILFRCVKDYFVPLIPLLYQCFSQTVVEVEEDLYDCVSLETVDCGLRCNGEGNLVFSLDGALQWFLTSGLKSVDQRKVYSIQLVRKKNSLLPIPLVLFVVIHPDFQPYLMADIFISSYIYKLERALDYRYELLQDWEEADDDLPTRKNIIQEIEEFSIQWSIDIPSLCFMKSTIPCIYSTTE